MKNIKTRYDHDTLDSITIAIVLAFVISFAICAAAYFR